MSANASRSTQAHTDGWCATPIPVDLKETMAQRLNVLEATVRRCEAFLSTEALNFYRAELERLARHYGLVEVPDGAPLR